MSSIIKIRNKKTGIVYAYEQEAKWDASKGQSRPERKYLGRYIEETGEIVPSSGKRGRPKTNKEERPLQNSAEAYLSLKKENESLSRQLEDAQNELSRIMEENSRLKAYIQNGIKNAEKLLSAMRSSAL